jgi:hypothetical protein
MKLEWERENKQGMDPTRNVRKMTQIVPNMWKENDAKSLDNRNQNSPDREWRKNRRKSKHTDENQTAKRSRALCTPSALSAIKHSAPMAATDAFRRSR